MNFDQITSLVTLGLCLVFAAFLGFFLANEEYGVLLLLVYVVFGMFLFFAPGYVPLIALGLVSPINVPILINRQFPLIALVLAICVAKFMVQHWMTHLRASSAARLSLPLSFGLFFGWVLMRYCIDPVIPHLRAVGGNVTGFRQYFAYAACFGLVLFAGLFVHRMDDLKRLLRWMVGIAVFFILLLVPVVLINSSLGANILARLGMFVTSFDTGSLRFAALSPLGLVVVVYSMLPRLSGWGRTRSRVVFGLGLVAIVMGGNRVTFLGAALAVAAIAVVHRRWVGLMAAAIGLVALLGALRYVGENYDFRGGAGVMRVLSLVSPRVAELTGADRTVIWRRIRWERAMQDIRQRPWIGNGYGGLENAFIFSNLASYQSAMIEVDLATGGVHNGYLSAARTFGVPGLGLFLVILVSRLYSSGRLALRFGESDPERSDLHGLAFAHLVAFLPAIYISYDLNYAGLWFYLIMGVLVEKIRARETAAEVPADAAPALTSPQPATA